MPDVYRIFGAELSPYSVKVRSYFRYKRIPHDWIVRTPDTQPEFDKYARLPLIPLVVTPSGDEGMQDSTPILEKLEAVHPDPSIHPDDPALAFLSALIEEFGDEWGNKWMFHYRWAREVDQKSGSERLAGIFAPAAEGEEREQVAEMIRGRMTGRVWFVGSSEITAEQIEDSYKEAMAQLDDHLAERPYLFGHRPSFGDFGLWGQVYNAWTDPTAGAVLNSRHANVVRWVEEMLDPRDQGHFESWESLETTLAPFLRSQVGGLFLPWSRANARALADGEETFSVELGGRVWQQKPQKYHARSLAALGKRYDAIEDKTTLDPILKSTGCSI